MEQLIKKLKEIPDIAVLTQAPMKDYTSFQIGGPAEVLVQPETVESLCDCAKILQQSGIKPTVIGAGSNLVVSDRGIAGVVLRLAKPMSRITVEDNILTAEAGVSLAQLAATAQKAGLSGLEFASGIPGTLGGAVFMNAGAYGGEMKDVVIETDFLAEDGSLKTLAGDAHQFAYRKSAFSGTSCIILRSRLHLSPGDPDTIRETMRELNSRRKEKQPLNYPSAGSFFKRPEGHFAGKLLEDAGLKGLSCGGAQISEKHAGFMINTGGATAQDVCALMNRVQKIVYEQFGVSLEPEVRFLGDFSE